LNSLVKLSSWIALLRVCVWITTFDGTADQAGVVGGGETSTKMRA